MDKDIPSSNMSSLLLRTIALASAMICLCPTDRFVPPLAMSLSNVIFPSSISDCTEYRPAERKESWSSASSCSENGSRLCRRVPLISSGYKNKSLRHSAHKCMRYTTYNLGDDSDVATQSIQVYRAYW